MSLSKDRLKQIIKEELSVLLNEEAKSPKETLEDLGFYIEGDFEEGELESAIYTYHYLDIEFRKLDDGRFSLTVRQGAPDDGIEITPTVHDTLGDMIQHIQQELGEDGLTENKGAKHMKLSKDRLKQIIKEELSSLLSEETDLEAEANAAFEDLVANGYKGLPEREMYIKIYIDLRTGDNPLRPKLAQQRAMFGRPLDPLEMSHALLPAKD
jgi:acyl carrier protein